MTVVQDTNMCHADTGLFKLFTNIYLCGQGRHHMEDINAVLSEFCLIRCS